MPIYDGSGDPNGSYRNRMTDGGHEQEQNGERNIGQSGQVGPTSPTTIFNPYYTGRPRTPGSGGKQPSIDRQELIKRIKSRESRPASPELERPTSAGCRKRTSPTPQAPSTLGLEQRPRSPEEQNSNQAVGLQIERPRSALHRGDFREKEEGSSCLLHFGDGAREEQPPSLSTSPVAPWHPDFPAAIFRQSRPQRQRPPSPPGLPIQRPVRSRAVSNASLATSFVYKPPTSPLAQSSRPDTPEPGSRRKSRSPDKSRRHTFSPESMLRLPPALGYPASARSHAPPPTLRAEKTFPYQAHQPRRSLNTFQNLPQTPIPNSRKSSFSDSPLQHAPMVGSYEESILRGRMSTTPSKPLNFVAQIGVLGKGDCKPTLRCPPHVSIAFPAVFYSYGPITKTLDQPSPYVGMVDLENNLAIAEPSPGKRRQRLAALSPEGSRSNSSTREDGGATDAQARRRRHAKQKRRSGSPKVPAGGSYRIPQQGQLQVIIKNPNKTAVKLFLIPYDLSDMEAGQKTFIRQRSYSAGPIIDMPMSSRTNLGTDRPEAALNTGDDPYERPTLRYLIHLHICCPSKGRYFLYKSVRVVFANRVPDGKEKLRNEIQLPEPRYSGYKPSRDSNVGDASSNTPRDLSRRQSTLPPSPPPAREMSWAQQRRFIAQSLPTVDHGSGHGLPMQPLPFHHNVLPTVESRPSSRQTNDGMELGSDRSHETQSSRSPCISPTRRPGEPWQAPSFRRLNDPLNFERDSSRERQPGVKSESLLSSRLRDLAFQRYGQEADEQ